MSVKVVFGENLTWYEKDEETAAAEAGADEDQTDAWYYIEDINDLSGVPAQINLDELTEYANNSTDKEKALEPYASAVVWTDQTIAAGEEEEYVFYAAVAEGVTTTDELPALYFAAGEQVENTAEDQTVIQWKNEALLAENETEAETETETESETETEAECETETESGAEIETETAAETETEIATETAAETESETQTDTETESESETEEAYNFIVCEVSEGGEICLTYVDGYTETITPYMMSDDYDVEVNMPVTEEVEVSVTAYDGYAYVCAAVLDEDGNTIAAYDADTTAFTVTANADYKTTVQVTFAEDDEAYYFSEEMLEVASYEQLAAAAEEDDPDTLQGQINALLSSDTDSGISTASEEGIATAALVEQGSSGTIKLEDDYTEDLMIWDGVNVTINLNGHTITSVGSGKNAITVYGALTLTDSSTGGAVVNGTSVSARGVLVAQAGVFTMEGGTISGFSVSGNGGGVSVENGGTFAMTGGTIDGNTATSYGGGVFLYEADQIANMTGGTISNNTSGLSGGGLAANQTTSKEVTLNADLTIKDNTAATYGGGFYFNNAITTLTISSTISGNTSTSGAGGGVYFGASVTTLKILDATIDGNTSGAAGGGAYFAVAVPTATIRGSSISGNKAGGNGGGIWLNAGTSLTLENSENNTSRIDNNTISSTGALFGGGIFLYSTNASRSTFISTGGEISGNIIDSTDLTNSYGGGISIGSTAAHAYATVNMSNTTVSNNSGATLGGGVAIYTYAQEVTFTNLTVSGNKAIASATASSGYGGGVYVAGNSACTVTVSGGTFSKNSADYYGGGMYVTTAASSLVLQDAAKFDGNTSYNGGGGIYTEGQLTLAGGDSTDTAIQICNNVVTSGVGGGVYSSTVNSYAINATGYVDVYENSAGTNGGGLCVNAGGMDLSGHITIHNNYSRGTNYGGAGLYAGSNTTGTVWLHDGVYIYENTSNLHGGGVYARWGLKIEDGVYIYDNYANSTGGGVQAITLDMSGGEIHDNSAANGGGVYIVQGTAGSTNPESCILGGKIYNNTARTGSGGGVYENSYPNILYIKGDVEIYDNSAYSYGGGVYVTDLFSFSGGIITGNTAQRGGGVYIIGYLGQKATIEISGTDSGAIYDNTATTVNYGNDVALGYNSASVSSDNSTTLSYPSLNMGAASTFTDTANGITGASWYDEVGNSTTEEAISTKATGSTQSAGQYYTLVYKTTGAAVAEIWNTEDNKYENFSSVQEAVDAVESNSSVYGTEGGSDGTITIIMLDDNREDVTIPTGISVTLDLAGCTLTGLAKSVITVDTGATLVIDDSSTEGTGLITGGDGTYYNYESSKYAYCGGGLLVLGSATFKGGTISGNVAALGGGVYVVGKNDTSNSENSIIGTFVLDGGTITGNTATSNGGGVCVYSGYSASSYKTATTPNFTMKSGTITANKGGSGAGVYVYVYAYIEISGGSITNNTCSSSTSVGGGMYIYSQTLFNMTGGLIIGNTAVTGGGIYSNNYNSSLTFSKDTQIYGNTATSNIANDIYATITNGSISVLAASSMGNASYTSWFDSNGDGSSYPYYYTEAFTCNKPSSNHIFALTATNYSGGYVAYIPDDSGNMVYQIATDDGNGGTTYSYTMDLTTRASVTVSASAFGTAYSTIQGAINAAATGDTIYLLCDCEESLSITGVTTRTKFTIDLNGYTLYSTGDYGFYINFAKNVEMDITIQSTSGTFANTESDAVGTITKAKSNSSSFPYGIYIPARNDGCETYLTVDSVLITGFGNKEQAEAASSTTYSGAGIYANSWNSVTLTGTTKITDCYAYQGGGVYMTGQNIYLTMGEKVVVSGNTAYQGGGVCFNATGDSVTDGVFKGYTETVTINGSEISGNTSVNTAGGLYIIGWSSTYNTSEGAWPKVTITDATISGNTAGTEVGGAYLLRVPNATITGSYITDNYSTTQYGGMYINASTPGVNTLYTITDSYFTGNTSGTNYAGLTVSTGVAKISNCTFTGNTSSTGCAALYLATVAAGSTLSDCTFEDNESTTTGYIVYITSSYLDVCHITVTGNTTATNTGAVCVHANSGTIQGDVTISESDISNNSGYGLDLYLQNDLGEIVTVTNTIINNNFGYGIYMRQSNNHYKIRSGYILNIGDGVEVAYNGNTGIYANGYGTLNINGGKIHDNTGSAYGGGVHAEYTDFNMLGGEIYKNSATKGGGVYLVENAKTYEGITEGSGTSQIVYGQAAADTITGGKIYDNTSTVTTDSGGGIYVGAYDKLVMTGGTVTGNTAGGQGGGVYMSATYASLELGEDATEGTVGKIYGNTASLGQDVYAAYSDASTSLLLISASDMLSSLGLGWLDESRETVTEDDIEYTTVKKYYALTLEYTSSTAVAVIWNAKEKKYDAFTSVQDAVDALYADKNNSTNYYYTSGITDPEIILVDNAVGNVEISGGMTLTINLNGYTLRGYATAITCYGTLTIKDVQYTTETDSSSDTYCAHYEALEKVNQNLHLDENNETTKSGAGADESGVKYTGTITGTTATLGGGVRVYSGGYATMVSGQIANCVAGGTTKNNASYGGAGVYVENGTFVLSGTASINNCSTKSYGAAVYIAGTSGTFILEEDAVIEDNTSYYGTVYMRNGSFKMTGGTITGNTAEGNVDNNTNSGYGGGLFVYAGTAKLTGGEISGNIATGRGGGIYINSGTVTLSGSVKITDNSVTGTSSTDASIGAGGGIYVNSGTLYIRQGAEITGNTSIRGGGIYQYNGTVKMSGGQVTGNSADYGGGLVQYPTQSGIFTMTGGVLCDNTSTLGSAGNDVYSVSESGYTYSGTSNPSATLVRAADMDYTDEDYNASYNVWKDDGYSGSERTAEYVGEGQYITKKITSSKELMLTAEKYGETTGTTATTSKLAVQSLTLSSKGIVDGTSKFDEDDDLAYSSVDYSDGNGGTVTASDWGFTSLQNAVAGSWTAGNDESAYNGLVRTFDKVTYNCNASLGFNATDTGDENNTVRLYVQVTLPLTSDEAEMTATALDDYEVSESDDGKSLILLGYADVAEAGYNKEFSIAVNVKAMKNGDLIKPSFSAWIEENSANKETPTDMVPTAVTVSAAGKYNVTLLPNSQLAYTGYFDLATGEETTQKAYEEQGTGGTIIYGTILGYGITLSMWNDDPDKGMKGLEIPEGEISFDLTMTGTLSSTAATSTLTPIEAAPYVWAYKANENTESGNSLNDTLRSVNMNWNDEDDSENDTQYAYDGAPFNTRDAAESSCYSGGAWAASGNQPNGSGTTTTIQFSVSGYTVDSTYSTSNPTQTSDGNSSEVFDNTYSRAFSAGYVQMLYPIDTSQIGAEDYGYLSIYMEGIVSELDITSRSGEVVSKDTSDSEDTDLKFFVDWYGVGTYQSQALNEIVYLDNYVGNPTGLYVAAGGGETIIKTNYFNNASNGRLSGDGGTASTPLGSTVYIGSDINYSSDTIDATTRVYDPQDYNAIEYNYLTAVNLLQKFDADAYTPTGNYTISTTETSTTWSTNKTTTYDLTVLYAAKPDGTNWTKSDDYNEGYESPAPEMDQYGEEDLIYFKSLDDLYAYFEGIGKEGVCVGILYEFRDCCIRTGRSISVTSQMTVTNNFKRTGQTWCITNDVLGWSTYRPDYKNAYTYDLSNGTKTRLELSYQYSWSDTVYDDTVSGVTAYGAGGDPDLQEECQAAAALYTNNSGWACGSGADDSGFSKITTYDPGYVKQEYSGGWAVKTTHSGWYEGNSLLLYTMESSIAIAVADKETGSNTAKSAYNVGQGERTANFLVTPKINSSSSVANELVNNGTQAAEVEITITLPKHLNYNEGTIQFNYGTEDTDYKEGELNWETSVTENANGTTTITLKTTVSDISKALPTIGYSCTIGKAGAAENDSDEVKDGETLKTTANINIQYEEIGQISTYAKQASTTISVIKKTQSYIWIEAEGTQELGTDLVFELNYRNYSDEPMTIQMGDVLPYNGDERGTLFDGGYRVTTISLTFSDSTSYKAFLDANRYVSGSGTLSMIKYGTGYTCTVTNTSQLSTKLGEILDELETNGTELTYSSMTEDPTNCTVTYTLSEAAQRTLTQLANYSSGLGLYFYLPSVQANSTVQINVTLSPMSIGTGNGTQNTLIEDKNGVTQQGGNSYWDNLFYRVLTTTNQVITRNTAVLGSSGFKNVINRKITGIAWLDQDQDGIYNTTSYSTDKPLSGIEVYLYSNTEPDTTNTYTWITTGTDTEGTYWSYGGTKLYSTTLTLSDGTTTIPVYPAVNIKGNLVASVSTGTDGAYTFDQLAAGKYYVVFKDSDGEYYVVGSGSTEKPIDFSQLSVTETNPVTSSEETNKSQADYKGDSDTDYTLDGPASLAQAVITNEGAAASSNGIELPASFSGTTYISPYWNAGFCYIRLNMEKEWENIISDIEEKTAVTFTVKGTNDNGTVVVNDTYTLTQGSTSGTVSVSKNGSTPVASPTATVTQDTANNTVAWTLGTVVLQAKGSNGLSGTTITYKVTEAAVEPVKDTNGNVTGTQTLTGFVSSITQTGGDGASSSIMSVTATNTQVLYELALYKISTSSDGQTTTTSYLSNAEFTLYTDAACTTKAAPVTSGTSSGTSGASVSGTGTNGISTTDTGVGKLYIGQFTEGTYYLKETAAPSGYKLNQSIWKITIKYEDDTSKTEDDNNWTYTPKISVTLVQDANGNQIAENAQKTFDLTTSTSPAASTTGATDTVYVASTRSGSATGSTDPYTLYTLSFQMANEIIYALPATGSVGIVWPTLAGIALMLAALVINERKRWMADA
ncbi:MAG: right-handed parallel beta-helix repeat-containing protein [Clostridiales bacterium]|nr:right-handed parallel beta-helix repeat-containing protein [Clostridiales bacterium]